MRVNSTHQEQTTDHRPPTTDHESGTNSWFSVLRGSVAGDSALLFANTLISAVLGVLFWTIAARQYDVAAVGFTSALVSAITLIAALANLGLGPIVIRYLPVAGASARRLAIVATAIPATVALIATAGLAALPAGQALVGPADDLATRLLPIALAVATAIMLVQDSIFIARRQSGRVLIRGTGAALVRLALLGPCTGLGAFGLVGAFAAGVLAAVVLGAGAWRGLATGPGRLTGSLKQIASYGGTNYISGICSQTPQMLYPVLIALWVSHAAAGAFAFVWMAAALLMALPPSVANVLLTRLVDQPEQARLRIRRVTRMMVAISAALACAMFVVMVPFAQVVLPAAAGDIQAFLPIVLASTVLYAVVRLQSMSFALRGAMRPLLMLNGGVALAALGLPLLLLPRFGVHGLEAGWLLSQLLGVLLGWALERSAKPREGTRSGNEHKRFPAFDIADHSTNLCFEAQSKGQQPISSPDPNINLISSRRLAQRAPRLRGWERKDIPMLDLVIGLAAFALPLALESLGAPRTMVAGLHTAALLTWPGYVANRLLWTGRQLPGLLQRLALVPFLSILAIIAISLGAWCMLPQVRPELVYIVTLITMAAAILGLLVRGVTAWHTARPAPGRQGELCGALVLFAGLAAVIGLAVAGPQRHTGDSALAVYLDPQSAPTYNRATGSLNIPLIVANPTAAATTVEVSGAAAGHTIVTQQVAIAPGAERHIILTLAAPALRVNSAPFIDIQARSLDTPDDGRMLRIWVGDTRTENQEPRTEKIEDGISSWRNTNLLSFQSLRLCVKHGHFCARRGNRKWTREHSHANQQPYPAYLWRDGLRWRRDTDHERVS